MIGPQRDHSRDEVSVDLTDGPDALEERVAKLADLFDPVPESVVDAARAAFDARDNETPSDAPAERADV
jgi:hypothetical protein